MAQILHEVTRIRDDSRRHLIPRSTVFSRKGTGEWMVTIDKKDE
jgi:hypothetical protein